MKSRFVLPAALLTVSAGCASAQTSRSAQNPAANLRVPADNAQVKRALAHIALTEARTIEEQIAICEIPSPPFKEQRRAEDFARRLRDSGLQNVRIDSIGNVIGESPGDPGSAALVVSGHLDTVFPEGTDVTVRREGTILRGPGISDDCRGLSMVLAIARAVKESQMRTRGTVYFVGTVGEEGAGNLRGARHLLQRELRDRVAYFISLDTDGYDHVKDAVGSYRYRVTFKGPGGHSYEAFGMPNPMHAMGRAIARIADFQVSTHPKVTFNVGLVQGGTSVNAIAATSSFDIDMRGETAAALDELDGRFRTAVQQALDQENARWPGSSDRLTVELDRWGNRPAGQQVADAPILRATAETARVLGIVTAAGASSTDANVAIGMGIPAVVLGIGGKGAGSHSLGEWWDSRDSHLATQWAYLLVATLAGVK